MRLTRETRLRTLMKSVSWRFGGLLVTSAVAWTVTHRLDLATSIGLADTFVKLLLYYCHERLWLRIGYGVRQPLEYEI